MQFSLFGLTFHLYGLILGLCIVGAVWLFEWLLARWRSREQFSDKSLKKYWQNQNHFYQLATGALLGGVVGARVWHVLTDFHLYYANLLGALVTWQGGLSILGAVAGGMIGVAAAVSWQVHSGRLSRQHYAGVVLTWLDLAVLVVPLAQALGRLGNYVNQELYGLPTNLPWAIEIEVSRRLPQYTHLATYHPLFLYEIIGLLLLATWLWWRSRVSSVLVGSGQLLTNYLVGYALIRFFLDFWRLEKLIFLETALTVNQVIILIALLVIWGLKKYPLRFKAISLFGLIGAGMVLAISAWQQLTSESLGQPPAGQSQLASLKQLSDRSLIEIELGSQNLLVEVVSTKESISKGLSGREEIGSDGMLFVFERPTRTAFWMKEMKFDLDLIWLLDGEVVAINERVSAPAPEASLAELKVYESPGMVDMVLEIPAGGSELFAISPGDRLKIK